jgi:hypothetical protein
MQKIWIFERAAETHLNNWDTLLTVNVHEAKFDELKKRFSLSMQYKIK